MKNNMRGFGFYALLVVGLLMVFAMTEMNSDQMVDGYGEQNMMQNIDEGNVVRVEITQNEEVPTGILRVYFIDGTSQKFYIPNTAVIGTKIADRDENVPVYYSDVKRQSFFVSQLPLILVLITMIFLFIFITG